MRNYWLRIALGAVAIFTVGMIGISLARQGVGRVRHVVEGTGPIALPLAFIPFQLDGQKLGNVSRVVLLREAPKQISAVELEAKVRDSAVARGLEGCRLAANFDADRTPGRVGIRRGPHAPGIFSCLHAGDSTPGFQEFGRAIFQPGNVTVPLLLPDDMVNDLREGHFQSDFDSDKQDSISAAAEAQADSIGAAVEARADSIAEAAESRADSIEAHTQRLVDSLRQEGERRADSTRRAAPRRDNPNPTR
jgi:hypothetical protein